MIESQRLPKNNIDINKENLQYIIKQDMKSDLHVLFRQHAVTEIMDCFLKE